MTPQRLPHLAQKSLVRTCNNHARSWRSYGQGIQGSPPILILILNRPRHGSARAEPWGTLESSHPPAQTGSSLGTSRSDSRRKAEWTPEGTALRKSIRAGKAHWRRVDGASLEGADIGGAIGLE